MLVDGQSRLAGLLRDISNTTLIINCNLVDWDQGDRIKAKKVEDSSTLYHNILQVGHGGHPKTLWADDKSIL